MHTPIYCIPPLGCRIISSLPKNLYDSSKSNLNPAHPLGLYMLLMWLITLTGFWKLNQPGWTPSSLNVLFLFMYCWIWFTNILIEISEPIFLRDIGLWFYFLVTCCLSLVLQMSWSHRMSWGVFPHPLFSEFEWNLYYFFHNWWQNLPIRPFSCGALLWRSLFSYFIFLCQLLPPVFSKEFVYEI